MNSLEIEYKNKINNDIPDLWDRIEAGITAIDNERTQNDNVVSINKVKKKTNWNKIAKYGSIVTAAACVLIVTALVIMNGSGNRSFEATAPMANEAVAYDEDVYDEATSAAQACEVAEEACDEAVCEAAVSEAETATFDDATDGATEDMNSSQKAYESAVKSDDVDITEEMSESECISIRGYVDDYVKAKDYAIIKVMTLEGEYYIFVSKDMASGVIEECKENEKYDFTIRKFSDEDDKPKSIAQNDDVKYELICME